MYILRRPQNLGAIFLLFLSLLQGISSLNLYFHPTTRIRNDNILNYLDLLKCSKGSTIYIYQFFIELIEWYNHSNQIGVKEFECNYYCKAIFKKHFSFSVFFYALLIQFLIKGKHLAICWFVKYFLLLKIAPKWWTYESIL